MGSSQVSIVKESRNLLKEAALNVTKKLEALLEKEPLNSFIPEQLAVCYKILNQWERSREMKGLSQRIEERLMNGNPDQTYNRVLDNGLKNSDYTLLPKKFMRGFFSGLTHPIAFFHHVDSLKNVLKDSRFSNRFVNMLGRFCGGFPAAYGLVYSVSRFYDKPRIILPLGLTLIATNSASAYSLLWKAISSKFEDVDDDRLVGFYKAFKGDLEGAYNIFKAKKDKVNLEMIGDFYLDEAEAIIKKIEKESFFNQNIMSLLMEKSIDIYSEVHDPTNIPRIASDYLKEGFTGYAEDLWRVYSILKNEKNKDDFIIGRNGTKPIFHLSQEVRETLVRECSKMCRLRYTGHSVKLPYTTKNEKGLFKALSLMDNLDGAEDITSFIIKAQIYELLGFKKMAKRYESAINSIELSRITMEERAKTLKKFKKLHIHAHPLDKVKSSKAMKMKGYLKEEEKGDLTEEAIEYLSK